MNFKEATLIDLMRYLEDLEQDSYLTSTSLEETLDKRYRGKVIPKDIYNILLNTIKATKNSKIMVDGVLLTEENPETPVSHTGRLVGPMENINICKSKSAKEVGAWLMDRPEWTLDRVNSELGAEFIGKESSDKFSFNVNNGMFVIVGDEGSRKYFFKKDFIAMGYENGNILLMKSWYDDKDYYEVIDFARYNNTIKENEIA